MALRVEGLSCGYGEDPIVKNISFELAENKKLCILGPNGSGKTTLLRAVSAILPYTGTVTLGGLDVAKMPAQKRASNIALMSQFSPAVFGYTVYETVAMGRYAHTANNFFWSKNPKEAEIIRDSMEKTGVWHLKDKNINELSGGQVQRVFLARAFAQQPKLLLLDEPTNHLDLSARKLLTELLDNWVSREGRIIIGVFHDISLALSFSDEALLLDGGVIVEKSPVPSLNFNVLNKIYSMDVRQYMRKMYQIWR